MPRWIDADALPVYDLWKHEEGGGSWPVRAVLIEDVRKAEPVQIPKWNPVTPETLPPVRWVVLVIVSGVDRRDRDLIIHSVRYAILDLDGEWQICTDGFEGEKIKVLYWASMQLVLSSNPWEPGRCVRCGKKVDDGMLVCPACEKEVF